MFSTNHRQHLLVAFKHLDGVLIEILARLGAAPGEPLFDTYHNDVDPVLREPAQQAVAALRASMRDFLERHAVAANPPDVSLLHALHATLALAQVGATELAGRHLRGYGELDSDEGAELDALSQRLRAQLAALDAALGRPR